jgi:hypothetical protein
MAGADEERRGVRHYFSGVVERGELKLDDPARWRGLIARFEGKRVSLAVTRHRVTRSVAQNKWYWAIVVPIFGEWSGYEKDEAHEVLKALFLRTRKVLPTGEEVEVPGSTAALDTAEFSSYCERVSRFLSGHGVYVPAAGEGVEVVL